MSFKITLYSRRFISMTLNSDVEQKLFNGWSDNKLTSKHLNNFVKLACKQLSVTINIQVYLHCLIFVFI